MTQANAATVLDHPLHDKVGRNPHSTHRLLPQPDALTERMQARLNELRAIGDADPFANAVLLLSLEVKRLLREGDINEQQWQHALAQLTMRAFANRADRLRDYLGEVDPSANDTRLHALFTQLASGTDGTSVPFDAFRRKVERAGFGLVMTAHPTFGIDVVLQRRLVCLATGYAADGSTLDDARLHELCAEAAAMEHKPSARLDLDHEHTQSVEAIGNLLTAVERAYAIALDVAAEHYPERWTELNPALLTVATWVGYDLDGRSDIPWSKTFAKALAVHQAQLLRLSAKVLQLAEAPELAPATKRILELLASRTQMAARETQDALAVFEVVPVDAHKLAETARTMHAKWQSKPVDAAPLQELIADALKLDLPHDVARGLCVMRAALNTQGLCLGHAHMRLNATQLHNAVRQLVDLDGSPAEPGQRLSYLNAIAKRIDEVEPTTINFGSILQEQASAKQVMMVTAQILRYIDRTQPIRFLIAECETGFTLLSALYYAKRFGVADHLDISPLFETQTALEHGDQVIAEALRVPAFRAYVRKRGRLCIQMGYSDAGRYLGQTAAATLIERLRLKIGQIMADEGMNDIELVVFDTHGESIGRGGHPGSLRDRLAYVDTMESRRRFKASGLKHKQEVSFQGGDGYTYFLTEPSAYAVLTRILEHSFAEIDPTPDPFYAEADYVEEFFTLIKTFNTQLMDDPDFAALLGAFGANFLYPSGSRAMKRQHDAKRPVNLEHPSQMRAIPQNAIMQQLGYLANSISGLGKAVNKDPETFQTLYLESERFRRLMNMVEHAFMYSDLAVLKAYIDLYDPNQWQLRARRRREGPESDDLLSVADEMERLRLHERFVRVFRVLHRDYIDLSRALRDHRRRMRARDDQPIAITPMDRDNLNVLHAIRLGLMQQVMLLAVHIPQFSLRHDMTYEELIERIYRFDLEPVLAQLQTIFPLIEQGGERLDFGAPADYQDGETMTYGEEHRRLFRPMARSYHLIRRISSGVVHNIGALG